MSKFNNNGVLFLQEKHSSIKNGNTWVNDFSCPVFFSRGASNSYCFLIPYPGKKYFVHNKQKIYKAGRSLILDIMLDAEVYFNTFV